MTSRIFHKEKIYILGFLNVKKKKNSFPGLTAKKDWILWGPMCIRVGGSLSSPQGHGIYSWQKLHPFFPVDLRVTPPSRRPVQGHHLPETPGKEVKGIKRVVSACYPRMGSLRTDRRDRCLWGSICLWWEVLSALLGPHLNARQSLVLLNSAELRPFPLDKKLHLPEAPKIEVHKHHPQGTRPGSSQSW